MNKQVLQTLVLLAVGTACIAQTSQPVSTPAGISTSKKLASSSSASKKHPSKAVSVVPSTAASKEELEQLRKMIAEQNTEQSRRLDEIQQQNQQLVQKLQVTQEKLSSAELQIGRLETEQKPQITKLQSDVKEVKSAQVATATVVEVEKKRQADLEHPTSLHYRGVTLTPGGFIAAEAVYRGHAENTDMGTSWVNVPYSAQTMSRLSEFRASARSSRLSLNAQGDAGRAKLTGYFEADFQASGFGASEVSSNGYSDRIRQVWGRVALPSGWTVAGGQMWSLFTTNRKGINNLTEYTAPIIDASQFIGNDNARQTSFRVTKLFAASKVTAAFSVENPATVAVVPTNVAASVTSRISGLSTTGSGVLSNTTYSTNVAPDLIAKVAFDPKFGHYEIKVMGRSFRDRLNSTAAVAAVLATKTTPAIPAVPAMPGSNNTVLGGGIGAAAYLPLVAKKVDYIVQGSWGNVGRYGATATDVVVKPNGRLSPEKSIHVLTGFETHPLSKLDWYIFGSDEYLYRNYGYGLKTADNSKCFAEATYSCANASVKSLAGATTGIWYRFYKGGYGTVQYGAEYSYIYKDTWSGKGGAPRGIENVAETSLRYYLP